MKEGEEYAGEGEEYAGVEEDDNDDETRWDAENLRSFSLDDRMAG